MFNFSNYDFLNCLVRFYKFICSVEMIMGFIFNVLVELNLIGLCYWKCFYWLKKVKEYNINYSKFEYVREMLILYCYYLKKIRYVYENYEMFVWGKGKVYCNIFFVV